MATTTLRLPETLKARVAAAAADAGQSVHSYLLDAIADKTARDEQRSNFAREAEARYAALVASGHSIDWSDMRQYLLDRAQGKEVTRPSARMLTP